MRIAPTLVTHIALASLAGLCLSSCSSTLSLLNDDASNSTSDVDTSHGDAGASPDGAPPESHDAAPTNVQYTNPVFALDFPDPFVLRDGDHYYAFSTNAAGKNVRTAMSTDLATWTELPDALPTLPSWAKANASLTWAPAVLRRGNTYVLYFTARSIATNFQCIGRATSQAPEGPYVDESSGPFICQTSGAEAFCGSIDASPFVDENGDAYLLWKSDENAVQCNSNARLWIQRLGVDGISLLGTPTALLERDQAWESPLVEGPSMLKVDDHYYLFYSGGWWESSGYAIGYAVCDTPLGPCTKKTTDSPLVKSIGEALGPGGQEFFTDRNGKIWMAYHAWTSPLVGYGNGGVRSFRIDPIEFIGGAPSFAGPSTTPRHL